MGRDASDEPDGAIVRRTVAGDVGAFELLLDRHAARVRRLVARNVPRAAAAEVAHDAFVAAYVALPSYADDGRFERWLVRIALRACADYWRARARSAGSAEEAELDLSPAPSPETDDRELCEWALARLDREDREVLALVYFEELSVKECAQVLSWSPSKVKVRAHRARARLRAILARVLPERGRER